MASLEFILSESEWQNLILFKDYVKQLYEVDVRRKDEGFEFDGGFVDGPVAPSPSLSQGNVSSQIFDLYSGILFPTTTESDNEFTVRPPPVIVQIQTNSSPANLEKCRKFFIACSPSSSDFKFTTIKLENQHSLEMVKACLPSIRQSTATLINGYPESLDITVQGHHQCVDLAQKHIDMILRDHKSTSSETQVQALCNVNSSSNQNHSMSPRVETDSDSFMKNNSNPGIQNNPGGLTAQTTNDLVSSPAKSDDSVFFSEDHGDQNEDIYDFSALSNLVNKGDDIPTRVNTVVSNPPPFQAYSNVQSDCVRDSETEQRDILADGQFRNHIVQATKWGYSEEQIVNVLKKLGVNSSMEDMMRELLSEPQGLNQEDGTGQNDELDNEVTVSPRGEDDSDDSEGFDVDDSSNLRHIIIDGSNVAMSHGQKMFSCLGIKIVVNWFKNRGHKNITVFVPQWRKEASRPDAPISNQEILTELEAERIVVFTPSRRVGGTRIVCYDDRFILKLAVEMNGIVVSNDVYRDLQRENDSFKEVVAKRLLMYSFVQDMFMPPEDPLGREGPSLDNFLRIRSAEPKNKPQTCPYGKKCTYGNKCRFYHPERRYTSQKMVAEKLKESAELKLKSSKAAETFSDKGKRPKLKLSRTVSLVPQDVTADISKSEVSAGDKAKKPVLNHSKSLVYPNSYLTDLRRKMEEAETAESFQDTSAAYVSQGDQKGKPTEVRAADGSCNEKLYSHSCNASPRTSPTPHSEWTKSKVKAVRSFPTSPGPNVPPSLTVNSINSSLNIPNNPEPQDRYLSGHLLVVKKLSDEDNNNGKFFSEHTSRATGTLQPQGNQGLAFDETCHSGDSNRSPVSLSAQAPIYQPLESKDGQESSHFNKRDIHLPPEITSQVCYDEMAVRSKKAVFPTNPLLAKENEPNPPTHAFVPNAEQYNSWPMFNQRDEVRELPQTQYFQRSLSTSTSPHSIEYMRPSSQSFRKNSLGTISTKPVEQWHAKGKPHSSVPVSHRGSYNHQQYNANAAPFHPRLTRNRVSVDSGISSGGLSVDYHSLMNSPFSPTENLSSPFSYHTDAPSPVALSPVAPKPARFVMQPQDSVYNPNLGGLSSPPFSLPYSPLPSKMQPFFQDKSRLQNPVSTSSLSFQSQQHPHPPIYRPPPPQPQPMSPMAHYLSCPPPPPNQPQLQQPSYPPTVAHSENQQYYHPMSFQSVGDSPSLPYSPGTPYAPFLQQPPSFMPQQQSTVIDEEAPINMEDPRYSIYYNLSAVYGERAVRTFMNRNPDVKNINELYSLISAYKQETGI